MTVGTAHWQACRVDLIAAMPVFVLAVVLISASPGPAMALIIRRAALRGWRAAVPVLLGLEVGIYFWAIAAAAGAAALLAASEVAYTALRIAGAGYLGLLGLLALRSALRGAPAPVADGATSRRTWWRGLAEGLVTSLANPKAALFMLAFYPQFVPESRPLLATTAVLAVLQVVIETCLYLALAVGVGQARTWFNRPKVRRGLEAVSGTVLIGLGVRVAASTR